MHQSPTRRSKQTQIMENELKKTEKPKTLLKNYFSFNENLPLQQISMNLIDSYKSPLFKSDIGYYYSFSCFQKWHAKRLKISDVNRIFQTLNVQFERVKEILSNEFQICKKLYEDTEKYLRKLERKSQNMEEISQLRKYRNFKSNPFLQYYDTKFDLKQGCYLFHSPIIITLDQIIKQGNLNYEEKINLMSQILEIVSNLHQINIIHRCITSYSFVVAFKNIKRYSSELNPLQLKKNFKYDPSIHCLKITGFYQQITITSITKKTKEYPTIFFQNVYTDPNSYNFETPQFASDLWSVLILFYQILTGKVPQFNKNTDISKMMTPWQKQMFEYYFQGTNKAKICAKDLKMRMKNFDLTKNETIKILQKQLPSSVMGLPIEILEKGEKDEQNLTRRRAQSIHEKITGYFLV